MADGTSCGRWFHRGMAAVLRARHEEDGHEWNLRNARPKEGNQRRKMRSHGKKRARGCGVELGLGFWRVVWWRHSGEGTPFFSCETGSWIDGVYGLSTKMRSTAKQRLQG